MTISTLPVRSPLPNKQPSTRSAPAIKANSAAATAVPRSLCGCTLIITLSRRAKCRCIHSIWSAYTFGVATSTVAGKFRITLLVGVAPQASVTALHTSRAKSNSVAVKVSGLYSSTHSVCGCCAANSLIKRTAFTAMLRTSSRLILNTVSRKFSDVALYTCTIARFAPCKDSMVRRIKCSRAWVNTSRVTSAGICWPSINWRTKSKSVCEADGNATSISLKPISHKV